MQLTALYTGNGEMVVHKSRCGHGTPPDGGGYPEFREKLHFTASTRQEAMERAWPRSLAVVAADKLRPESWAARTRFQSCCSQLPDEPEQLTPDRATAETVAALGELASKFRVASVLNPVKAAALHKATVRTTVR